MEEATSMKMTLSQTLKSKTTYILKVVQKPSAFCDD